MKTRQPLSLFLHALLGPFLPVHEGITSGISHTRPLGEGPNPGPTGVRVVPWPRLGSRDQASQRPRAPSGLGPCLLLTVGHCPMSPHLLLALSGPVSSSVPTRYPSQPLSSYFSLESLLQKFILKEIDFQAAWRCNLVFHFEETMVKEKFGDLITTQGHGDKKFLCPCPETVEPVCTSATAENRCTQEGTGPRHPHAHTAGTLSHMHDTHTGVHMRTRMHSPPLSEQAVAPLGIPSPLPASPSAVQGGAQLDYVHPQLSLPPLPASQ